MLYISSIHHKLSNILDVAKYQETNKESFWAGKFPKDCIQQKMAQMLSQRETWKVMKFMTLNVYNVWNRNKTGKYFAYYREQILKYVMSQQTAYSLLDCVRQTGARKWWIHQHFRIFEFLNF